MKYFNQIKRAQMLLSQDRYDLAEQTLRSAIAEEPDEGLAYSILSLLKVEQKKYDEAQTLAERALHLSPSEAFGHYANSAVLMHRGKLKTAHASIDAAIQLDPTEPDFHGHKALVAVQEMKWKSVIESAETGLMFDPEHVNCKNLRAIALTRLGKRDEAGLALESALASNPEDSYSHANVGWNELHQKQPDKAAEHFKEALRLDPTNEWARQGILESLKAKNWFYRSALGFLFWLSRFTPKTQMMLFIGVIVLLQVLVRMPEGSVLEKVGIVLSFVYMVFVGTMWMADPIFNLLLRFDRFGRSILTPEEVADTNYTAIAIVGWITLCSMPVVTSFLGSDLINYCLLLLPVAVCLNSSREARRSQAAIATILIWAIAFFYWYRWYFVFDPNAPVNAGVRGFIEKQLSYRSYFTWGSVLMTWAASYFNTRTR